MGHRISLGAVFLVCYLAAPTLAGAQSPTTGVRVGGFVSGSLGDGGPATALGVSAGYRFTPRLGLDVDVSYVPAMDFGSLPVCPPGVFCALAGTNVAQFRGGSYAVGGSALSLSTTVVTEIPVGLSWIRPYIAAGGGVSHVRRQFRDSALPSRFTIGSTGPHVTAGGGVEFPLSRGILVGIDLRYQRIFEDEVYRPDIDHKLTLTRLGSSLTYRF